MPDALKLMEPVSDGTGNSVIGDADVTSFDHLVQNGFHFHKACAGGYHGLSEGKLTAARAGGLQEFDD
jgi:hypothetical protein